MTVLETAFWALICSIGVTLMLWGFIDIVNGHFDYDDDIILKGSKRAIVGFVVVAATILIP